MQIIKAIVGSLAALALVAGLAGHADAASQQQKKRLKASQYSKSQLAKARGYRKPASSEGESDYYDHILDKAQMGSKRWWSIYDEQRSTPD